jgi:signal transduction histidine kinase
LRAIVYSTRSSARVDHACAVPILIDGNLWGVMAVSSQGVPLQPDVERRLFSFSDLVATAVSNAAARSELLRSRVRIVAAGDEARRRIERDLHDGTQQRLIALGLDLQRARQALQKDAESADHDLEQIGQDLELVVAEIREISRGLHPPMLARLGLRPALRALIRHSPIPVELDFDLPERPSPAAELAIYYVVSEALTNAIKHSRASEVTVTIHADRMSNWDPLVDSREGLRRTRFLHATIADDGIGGAQPSIGTGLIGLGDRIDALGGRFALDSPTGKGTRVSIALPVS